MNPVAVGWNACDDGRNEPSGFGGAPLAKDVMPRNASKLFGVPVQTPSFVNDAENAVAPTVPDTLPVGTDRSLGTNTLIKKSVPLYAGEAVTEMLPKPPGAGVNVPLSARHVAQVKCNGS